LLSDLDAMRMEYIPFKERTAEMEASRRRYLDSGGRIGKQFSLARSQSLKVSYPPITNCPCLLLLHQYCVILPAFCLYLFI
jgi:hypothetical protein